jgi:hypothetical protein
MAPTFAVVAEGPTDFLILRRIVASIFNDPDIVVDQLQPAIDETSGASSPGGWFEVFRYIGSERLAGTFERSDFVIVHIDTDVCEEVHFGVSRREGDGRERTVAEMIELTRQRLIEEIGQEVWARFQGRVIFAIAVESIECWLLPIYYADGRRSKIVNCLQSLNNVLSAREGFSIDPEKSGVQKYYIKILRHLRKTQSVEDASKHNPSFTAFVGALSSLQQRDSEG